MDKYVEGFLKLKIFDFTKLQYDNAYKYANEIQKCTILKNSSTVYSNNTNISE